MNAHLFSTAHIKKQYVTVVLSFVLSLTLIFGTFPFSVFAQSNTVELEETTAISNQYAGQATTDFIKSFYASGATTDDIEFVAIWWPVTDASNTHAVSGIGSRKANLPPTKKTEVTFDLPYSNTTPGTDYMYEIRDIALGKVYFAGTFTSPAAGAAAASSSGAGAGAGSGGGAGAAASSGGGSGAAGNLVNGLTVSKAVSGITVTFTIDGTPASGHDADFIFSYMSTANSLFAGEDKNFGTRGIGATTTQTLTYTLPTTPMGLLLDSSGYVVDPSTVEFDLMDGELNMYSFGTFQPTTASPGTGGTTATTAVTPKTAGNPLVSATPDTSGGLVPCDGRSTMSRCGWKQVVDLINKVLTWLLLMTVPIAAIVFSYAGFLFLTNGASEEARSKAKGIFINVFIGLIFIVAAVLIIKTILSALGVTGAYSSFL